MNTSSDGARRRFRAPAITNSAVTALILLAVAAIALPASQTPPPAIAEFSPQPQEQITDAPEDQSSDFGEGEGGGSGGDGATTTTTTVAPTATTVKPIEVPRVRRCVGNPPRQTEDPQSPPCVNYFEGDNGGATSKGVTANEIRIAIPWADRYAEQFLAHFNSRYEFYGRKLVASRLETGGDTPQAMLAKAAEVDTEIDAFASTSEGDRLGVEFVYYDELARRGVISVNNVPSMITESGMTRHHPFEWSYLPGIDVMARNKAEWICRSLRGKVAEFAGGSERAQQRKFALLVTVTEDGTGPDLSGMLSVLNGCGIDVSRHTYEMVRKSPPDDQGGVQQAQNVVLQMRREGITSIICECHTQSAGFYMSPVATSQGFYPEWLVGTYAYVAEDSHVQFNEGQQAEHSFGLSWWNKQIAPEESPWFWAMKDADPNFEFPDAFAYYDARNLYNSLLVLASGIQLAGPNLTPQTFATGLQRARFPNPNAGQAPYWQAGVGFLGDHTFVDDAALVWLSKSEPSTWGNIPGTVCYAQRGRRYRIGSWPTDYAGLFQRPCR